VPAAVAQAGGDALHPGQLSCPIVSCRAAPGLVEWRHATRATARPGAGLAPARAARAPKPAQVDPFTQLQRDLGNRGMGRLLARDTASPMGPASGSPGRYRIRFAASAPPLEDAWAGTVESPWVEFAA
jgi:hypothetical protein